MLVNMIAPSQIFALYRIFLHDSLVPYQVEAAPSGRAAVALASQCALRM